MIGVSGLDREAIARACERNRVARLRAFGSVVTDRFVPATSDLDFLVDFRAHAPKGVAPFLNLKDELERLA
ncbi:nucleotidyltransferase family protein [Microbacterium sp.]|uniref:nucleotidyltransferase family protein n=1 Tax=Microbacterium sp. TaxID=51671 RepID=UPI0039E5A7ED